MIERGIKPELEVFDKSMIEMALRLHKKGYIADPMHFDFVMGVNGGIGATSGISSSCGAAFRPMRPTR